MFPNSFQNCPGPRVLTAGILFEDLHQHLTPFVDMLLPSCCYLPRNYQRASSHSTRFPYPATEDLSSSCLQDRYHRTRMQHGMQLDFAFSGLRLGWRVTGERLSAWQTLTVKQTGFPNIHLLGQALATPALFNNSSLALHYRHEALRRHVPKFFYCFLHSLVAGILFEDFHYRLTLFIDHAVGLMLRLTQKFSTCLAALQEAPTQCPYPVAEDLEYMSSSCLQASGPSHENATRHAILPAPAAAYDSHPSPS